jgi:hypothetical protein
VNRHANGYSQGVVRHHWQISMAWSITILFYEVELVWPLRKVLRATQNRPETMESLAMNFRENSTISWNSTSRETSRSVKTDRNEEAYQHLEFLLSGFFVRQIIFIHTDESVKLFSKSSELLVKKFSFHLEIM